MFVKIEPEPNIINKAIKLCSLLHLEAHSSERIHKPGVVCNSSSKTHKEHTKGLGLCWSSTNPSMDEALGSIPSTAESRCDDHACNHSTQEFKVFLCYIPSLGTAWTWPRLYLASNKQTKIKTNKQINKPGNSFQLKLCGAAATAGFNFQFAQTRLLQKSPSCFTNILTCVLFICTHSH